ncbi:MAG: hypothetical protein OQK00_06325 [Rhodobacteraceae bacterium]|nr:hypothetical protein [Paracoccaceae bacterium]MCW9042749.1 hypothetical protein [Pseudopelagicola sp.]
MAGKSRFIKSIMDGAKSDVPAMPWARGARRQAFISKRNALKLERSAA